MGLMQGMLAQAVLCEQSLCPPSSCVKLGEFIPEHFYRETDEMGKEDPATAEKTVTKVSG